MEKKISFSLIVSSGLLILVLFAGLILLNKFSESNKYSSSTPLGQNTSSDNETAYPAPFQSETPLIPTSTATGNNYPDPTSEFQNTPTTEVISLLPPLEPYPAPGPFENMEIIFTQSGKPGYWIKSMNGEERKLTGWWSTEENTNKYENLSFKPSPAGKYLLFSASSIMNFYDPEANSFWVNELDGSKPIIIVNATEEWYPQNPIWSPDGKQIAYRRTYISKSDTGELITSKGFEIWLVSIDGSGEKKIFSDPDMLVTSFGGNLPLFQWLYNGYIYFSLKDPGTLYAVSPIDGTSYNLLDNIHSISWRISLSPDGQHIRPSIDVPSDLVKQAGIVPVNVPYDNENPKWSSNGKMLLYKEKDTTEEGKIKIILFDLVRGEKREVIKLKEKDKLLSLSPDGRFIAYLDEAQSLYVFDLKQDKTKLVIQGQALTQQNTDTIKFVDWVPEP